MVNTSKNLKEKIKSFWDAHPLCSYEINQVLGSREYFEDHDKLRRSIELFSRDFCEYENFKGKKGLDVGCGIGWVVCEYVRYGALMTGIDISSRAVELTKKRLKLLSLSADVIEADAEDLPFADNSFDFVTSYGVLHHTPETKKAIDEIFRVLKPGGKAFIALYYKNILFNPLVFPLVIRLMNVFKMKMHGMDSIGHVSPQEFVNFYDGKDNPLGKVYSKKEFLGMCSMFSKKQFEIHYFPARFVPFGNRLPTFLLKYLDRYLGFMIYFKGVKP